MGVNKIIVLSHSGYVVDHAVASNTMTIDVIVDDHSNTLFSNTNEGAEGAYPTMVDDTAIVQAYAMVILGELNVTFDDASKIVQAVGEPLVMDGTVSEDTATKHRIAQAAVPLEEIRNQVVAKPSAVIQGDSKVCRVAECEMGNLVADGMLDRVADQGEQIALANSGGLRASIDAGDVTMGEVLTVLPFQNTLVTFQISGQGVIDALENGVSQVEEVKGRFPQVAGLKFIWDPSVNPNEGRVVEVMVASGAGFIPIDPLVKYMVVTNNYVLNGGDGYKMFRAGSNAYDYGLELEVVLADYMAAQGVYAPYLDGRISLK